MPLGSFFQSLMEIFCRTLGERVARSDFFNFKKYFRLNMSKTECINLVVFIYLKIELVIQIRNLEIAPTPPLTPICSLSPNPVEFTSLLSLEVFYFFSPI